MRTLRRGLFGLTPFLVVIVLPLVIGELAWAALLLALAPRYFAATHAREVESLVWSFPFGSLLLGIPLIPVAERIWRRYAHRPWRQLMDREESA